jgi:hypothetical protein
MEMDRWREGGVGGWVVCCVWGGGGGGGGAGPPPGQGGHAESPFRTHSSARGNIVCYTLLLLCMSVYM